MDPENWPTYDLEALFEMLSQNPPWWVYVVVALVPLSLLFLARESACWFLKINRRARTLDRIEALLREQNERNAPERTGPTTRDDPIDAPLR